MNIESITIQNFRNIGEQRTFFLNRNFTAFIGINGKGKSTILHALRVASGAYFLGIPRSEVGARHIYTDEIRMVESHKDLVPIFPVNVEAKGRFPGMSNSITWRRQWIEGQSSATTKYADVGSIKDVAARLYERAVKEKEENVDIPVIAFFGISRAMGAGRVTEKSRLQKIGRVIFREAYQDWDEMKSVKFHYREWLARYDVLYSQGKEYPHTKQAFFTAIKEANPYISQLEFSGSELWVKVKIDDYESDLLPINLHSDGVHYFTEMVAELAYRCVVLNGFKEKNAIKDATGIVMIDELDLHLHPKWQRHVVNDLKMAFPNLQFVVTTHSPFIVQSLKSDEIWNLDKLMDVAPDELKIDTVATEIMGISSPYSETNEEHYIKSKKFMVDLDTNKSGAELQKDLDEISDPAVRAFLELQKISKGK